MISLLGIIYQVRNVNWAQMNLQNKFQEIF